MNETIWWLEALKIASPIASAFVLAVWISRKNQRYKTDLERTMRQFETRDSLLHTKRIEVMAELNAAVKTIHFEMNGMIEMLDEPWDSADHIRAKICYQTMWNETARLSEALWRNSPILSVEALPLLVDILQNVTTAKDRFIKFCMDDENSPLESAEKYEVIKTLKEIEKKIVRNLLDVEFEYRKLLSPDGSIQ